MTARRQDAYWPPDGPGGAMRIERHFGRSMRCFAERHASVDAAFRATLGEHADREAIVAGAVRWTYRELAARVDAVAANLHARDVHAGDRIVLLLGNVPEFLVVVLACARLGAIAVPVGTRQAASEVAHVVADCAAVAIVFESGFADRVPTRTGVPGLRLRFAVGNPVDHAHRFDVLLEDAVPVEPYPVLEEDTAVLLYTSGTTGRPKGAMLTHLGIVHSMLHFARCYALTQGDRTMLAVPASHVTGLVSLLLSTMGVGGCTVFLREFKAADFLRLAAGERTTYTLMVPAMYILCLRQDDLEAHDLRAWRVGGFGGSVMPESAIEAIGRRLPGLTLQNAYGATETTSPTTLMPAGHQPDHPDSVGQVVPCGDVIVVDADGHPVPDGEPGELCIGGPMVVPGYWNNPEGNARSFRDGRWLSGDIGSMDAEGYVRVFDRVKDMINRGGYKVFSAEVESVLARHPAVGECAVVAHPDPVLCERVKAIIVTDADLDADAIRAHCLGHLADYKVPEIVEFRREPLPRNANGKIQKNMLRATR